MTDLEIKVLKGMMIFTVVASSATTGVWAYLIGKYDK